MELKSFRTRSSFKIVLLYLAIQIIVSLLGSSFDSSQWLEAYRYLDASWYVHLATEGYTTPDWFIQHLGSQYAFFPVWPLLLKILALFIPKAYLQMAGALASLYFFIVAIRLVSSKAGQERSFGSVSRYLVPSSDLALLPLIFAPGSWVFFSNHTEALFMFLSMLAFYKAYQGELYGAAILAGLSALTRNQGVLVSVCVGLVFLLKDSRDPKGRMRGFLTVGFISGTMYSLWLAYLYFKTGTIFASMDAQKSWKIVATFGEYISNLLWLSPNNGARAFWFWSVLISTSIIFWRTQEKRTLAPISVYLIASILLWPLQGNNFPQAYRFGAVLFPFWIMLGNWMVAWMASESKSKMIAGISIALALVILSSSVTIDYFFQLAWPY